MSENVPETPASPVRPSSGVLDDICTCEEWAGKLNSCGSELYQMAVSFDCPKHGYVTIDARPLPERWSERWLRQNEREPSRNTRFSRAPRMP